MQNSRSLVWLFLFLGSAIGGFIPELWGDGFLSLWSVVLSAAGGIVGIYIGFKLSQ